MYNVKAAWETLHTHIFPFCRVFLSLVLPVPLIPSLLTAFADKGVSKCPSPTAALLSQTLTSSDTASDG